MMETVKPTRNLHAEVGAVAGHSNEALVTHLVQFCVQHFLFTRT